MIDYDDFVENVLLFDLRFSKLWPNNIERWTLFRDWETEWLLHAEYRKYAEHMMEAEDDPERLEFYTKLLLDLTQKGSP